MFKARILGAALLIGLTVQTGSAQGTDQFKDILSRTAVSVKATPDPVQKRQILDRSLRAISTALDRIESSGMVTETDRASMDYFTSVLTDKRDELAGTNGFERVPDSQLNAFADFVVQDMEQASQSVTISLVAALLIIIIVILLT